ncbi:MAG: lipopolysaccharide biosynthesis protein [Erythrobacter sp.]
MPPNETVPASPRRALVRNTAFSFGQQVAAMALAILLVPYMLWSLGAERYGLWLILQLFNIVGLAYLAELGFQGAIVRYLARFHVEGEREAFRGLLASGFALFVAIGLGVGGVVILFANTVLPHAFPIASEHREEMQLALTVIGAGLMAGFPNLVIKAYFAARQDLATTKVWELIDRVVFAIGVVLLLQSTNSLVALVLFEQILGFTLTIAFALIARRGSRGWFTLNPSLIARRHFRGVVRMSGSVFATNVVSQGFNRLPELFVGALLGPVTLTAYQLSTRIPRVIKTLQGSLNAAVMPHIAGMDAAATEGGGATRATFAVKGLRANYLVAVPLLVGISMLAPVLLELWVGAEYRHLAPYLVLFAVFQLLFLASNFCGATLVRQEHFRLFVRAQLAILGGFVAALTFGLEPIGLEFLFAALILAGLAMAVCVLAVFRQAHGVRVRRLVSEALLGPVLVSALAGTLLLAPGAWVLSGKQWFAGIAALGLGGLVYAGFIMRVVFLAEERAALVALVTGWRRRFQPHGEDG